MWQQVVLRVDADIESFCGDRLVTPRGRFVKEGECLVLPRVHIMYGKGVHSASEHNNQEGEQEGHADYLVCGGAGLAH